MLLSPVKAILECETLRLLGRAGCSLLSGATEQADQRSKEPNQNHHHRCHRHPRS